MQREHALAENGYTIFYHSASGCIQALQLFYKLLYSAVIGSSVRNDFEFLRFWADDTLPKALPEEFLQQEQRNFQESQDHVLSVNLSLFGNSSKSCCRTLSYFLESEPDCLSEDFLNVNIDLPDYIGHEIKLAVEEKSSDTALLSDDFLKSIANGSFSAGDDASDEEDDDVDVAKLAEMALLHIGLPKNQLFYDILADFGAISNTLSAYNNLLQVAVPNQLVDKLCYTTGYWCDGPQSLELYPQDAAVPQRPFVNERGFACRTVKSSKMREFCRGEAKIVIPSWKLREVVKVMRDWHELFSLKSLDTLQARLIINPDIVCNPDAGIKFFRYHTLPSEVVAQLNQEAALLAQKLSKAVAAAVVVGMSPMSGA